MIDYPRWLDTELKQALQESPAVVLLGPRQVGKTTLALRFADQGGVYLDLESSEDRSRLNNPEQYLREQIGRLVVLDEVQRAPQIFENLRGLIDRARRSGQGVGAYLLLGSASLDLLQQSSESLAGRVAFVELAGLHRLETPPEKWRDLWIRGGFPRALLAASGAASLRWRRDFVRTYLEREVAQFAPRVAAERLRRFWIMLAHLQASNVNLSQLGADLEVTTATASNYLDLLVDLLLVRRLPPWVGNTRKRLVKSPKIYLRDSGLLHALLGIESYDQLLSHPVLGASWEGHVMESLLAVKGAQVQASYYRSSAGAEIDLVLEWPGGKRWAIEIKHSSSPKLSRGFFSACEDVRPDQSFVVYSGNHAYPMSAADGQEIRVLPLHEAMTHLVQHSRMQHAV